MIAQPELRPIPHKGMYRLLEDYAIISRGHRIVVPGAFRFDGASIPSIGWRRTYTPFHPVVMAAALVHDCIYLFHQVPRDEGDLIFHDILIRNNADPERAWIMREAVEMFGGPHWEYSRRDLYELRLLYRVIRRRENFEEYGFPVNLIQGDDHV